MTDEELSEARESSEPLRKRVREDLAEDLGGDPSDDDSRRVDSDGGED